MTRSSCAMSWTTREHVTSSRPMNFSTQTLANHRQPSPTIAPHHLLRCPLPNSDRRFLPPTPPFVTPAMPMTILPTVFHWKTAPFSSVYYPVIAVVLYLTVIFTLRSFMRRRPPFRLRVISFLHNLFLTLLSLAMAVGVLAEVIKVLFTSPAPIRDALCDTSATSMSGRMGFWMYIFYISKFYELFDTVIMVLKKRPLNFLHVYHHCIVLPLFYVYMSTSMVLQWIVVVANSSVHVAMYYYYAMSALGHKVWWKKYITQAQIIQFIIDLTSTWPYPFLYFSNGGCSGSMRGWLFGQAVGASFFKLFCDFYIRSYRRNMKNVGTEKKQF